MNKYKIVDSSSTIDDLVMEAEQYLSRGVHYVIIGDIAIDIFLLKLREFISEKDYEFSSFLRRDDRYTYILRSKIKQDEF